MLTRTSLPGKTAHAGARRRRRLESQVLHVGNGQSQVHAKALGGVVLGGDLGGWEERHQCVARQDYSDLGRGDQGEGEGGLMGVGVELWGRGLGRELEVFWGCKR